VATRENKSAPTSHGYEVIWKRCWKDFVGDIALVNLTTGDITKALTHHAKSGLGAHSLSHMKWMLSAVYVYAIAADIVPKNPIASTSAVYANNQIRAEKTKIQLLLPIMLFAFPSRGQRACIRSFWATNSSRAPCNYRGARCWFL
jgi:hypothetical protein